MSTPPDDPDLLLAWLRASEVIAEPMPAPLRERACAAFTLAMLERTIAGPPAGPVRRPFDSPGA